MNTGRRTSSRQDRAEEQEIMKSLNVSSYLDDVYEAIHTGAAPKVNVPNYQQPTPGQIYSEIASESQGLSMNFDSLTHGMSDEQIKTAMANAHPERGDGQKTFSSANHHAMNTNPRFTISRNQAMALKKYPTLVEFLGRPEGERVARRIASDMNVLMAELVAANSKEANANAVVCKAERQNLRQYFQGEDWLCRVTASGPFRGDEAIYYSRDKDVACILRRSEVDGEVHYEDISDQFNIIYEAEEGIPKLDEKVGSQDEQEISVEIDEETQISEPISVE